MSKLEDVSEASMEPIVHTPGPWSFDPSNYGRVNRGGWGLLDANSSSLGVMVIETDVLGNVVPNAEANAKLIAAAPELLAACELVALWMLGGQPGPHSDSIVLEQVKLAIQKAKS